MRYPDEHEWARIDALLSLVVASGAFGIWQQSVAAGVFLLTAALTIHYWIRTGLRGARWPSRGGHIHVVRHQQTGCAVK